MRFLLAASVFLGMPSALINAHDPAGTRADSATPWSVYNPLCTQQQCEEIQRGMSVEAVTAILGCPPGDYTDGRGMYVSFIDPCPVDAVQHGYATYWCGEHGAVGLTLDQNRRVARVDWFPALDAPQ